MALQQRDPSRRDVSLRRGLRSIKVLSELFMSGTMHLKPLPDGLILPDVTLRHRLHLENRG